MSVTPPAPSPTSREPLRTRLLAAREQFVQSPDFESAQQFIERELAQLIERLEPECLGVYWPVRSEFNAATLWRDDKVGTSFTLALPFARRAPREMRYRVWDGAPPPVKDECGIAAAAGAEIVPDVVLVPCVGYTASGFRLGYGGGYFDRWLAAHSHVTAVGVAWSVGRVDDALFAAQPHDQPLTLIVTERGVA